MQISYAYQKTVQGKDDSLGQRWHRIRIVALSAVRFNLPARPILALVLRSEQTLRHKTLRPPRLTHGRLLTPLLTLAPASLFSQRAPPLRLRPRHDYLVRV
mmetsp:Transcript_33133/g.76408  ORF Transcript_33133/g.76408 Transcript_33133/m.76408 type:complete len:101 (-) Transcript_33133:404-706(-)